MFARQRGMSKWAQNQLQEWFGKDCEEGSPRLLACPCTKIDVDRVDAVVERHKFGRASKHLLRARKK